jgi:hypothetical protein
MMKRKTLVAAALIGALGMIAIGCEEKKPAPTPAKPPPASTGTTGSTGSTAAPK